MGVKKRKITGIDKILLILFTMLLIVGSYVLVYESRQMDKKSGVIVIDSEIESQEDVKRSPPVEEPVEELPEPVVESFEAEEDIEKEDELTVEIYRKEFNMGDLSVDRGTTVKWLNKDDNIHKMACYEGKDRFFTDENLHNGDSTEYTFDKAGEFLCLDAIFGIRQNIEVA